MSKKATTNTQAPKQPTRKNIHDGHRNRLRIRYAKTGMDDFEPHEILELCLTYCIRQKDVNPHAHALVAQFGSLSAVLDASMEELCTVPDIGEHTALFLKMIPDLARRYQTDKCKLDEPMDTVAKVADYLQALYCGVTVERVYLLLFDNSMRLIKTCHIGDGTINSVRPSMRKIAECALFAHAAGAVLVHNHPNGMPIASSADYEVTEDAAAALTLIEIPLIEHFIVADHTCVPIRRNRRGTLHTHIGDKIFDEAFYTGFYGDTPRA